MEGTSERGWQRVTRWSDLGAIKMIDTISPRTTRTSPPASCFIYTSSQLLSAILPPSLLSHFHLSYSNGSLGGDFEHPIKTFLCCMDREVSDQIHVVFEKARKCRVGSEGAVERIVNW
jgi:hypothetical protein